MRSPCGPGATRASGTPPASGWPSVTTGKATASEARCWGAALDLADNWLGVIRVDLKVYTDNEAGIALYEKFGFEIEGTHRRDAFRNGEYVDTYSMARLQT